MDLVPLDLVNIMVSFLVEPIMKPYSWLPLNKIQIIDAVTINQNRILDNYKKKKTYGDIDWMDLLNDPKNINVLKNTIEDVLIIIKNKKDPNITHIREIKKYPIINKEFLILNNHLIDPKPFNEKIINEITRQIYNIMN